MLIFILVSGSFCLLISYIYSSVFSRTGINENFTLNSAETRYIYNYNGIKLFAGFDILENARKFAVLYYGYGSNFTLLNELKEFYLQNGYSVISICANAFYKSEGKKKSTDLQLKSDLELWLQTISQMFGDNISIILHGFSSTALSCLIINLEENPSIKCIVSDCAHIFPRYLYRHIKSRILQSVLTKKSRINLSVINVPVFVISDDTLKKDSYKIYSLCTSEYALYTFESLDIDQYLSKLKNFITRLERPEESA